MKKPYFILPFDHRSTFAKKLMGFDYPTTPEQTEQVKQMKNVVFDAFLEARHQIPEHAEHTGILVDLEFGSQIIERAKKMNISFAVSTEKSGQEVFTFEYGDQFGQKLIEVLPTYAKALVRYDGRRKEDNETQRARLRDLSNFCEQHQIGLMIEPLMKGEGSIADQMVTCLKEMLEDGVKPTLWKLEGLDDPKDWKRVSQVTDIDIIVLGRGEDRDAVERWIEVGAGSEIVDGFAIGRTIFLQALIEFKDGMIDREEAVQKIAKNYLYFIRRWMEASEK